MKNSTKITIAVCCGLAPVILYSYASGPDPRMTGAPGDQTCARSGCHTGTALNSGGGSATLTSSSGSTYTPGQKLSFTLTITDSRARVYGFQATARPDSNSTNGQAGDFTAATQQIVICDNGRVKGSSGCTSSSPVQFIEHSRPFSTNTISFTWTAPSSDVGPVTIYAAANAANGNNDDSGDHIYTTSLKLTPAAATSNKPSISSGGVVSASAFSAKAGMAPGTWLEIFGSNLASITRSWTTADFNGNSAPTSLEGVSVTIDGKPAYVDFVSPGQVNVQVPDGIGTGSGIALVLTNSQGQTDPYLLSASDVAPALLAPASFTVNGKQDVVAILPSADASSVQFAAASASIPGVTTRPARTGEVITLYGIGFGPVSPATSAGVIATQPNSVANQVSIQIGNVPATVQYAGLAPGFVGLYQFNVQVPSLGAGDWPVSVQVNGNALPQTLYLTTAP
jgi:uncharacterized protein (TIGR03437 family)